MSTGFGVKAVTFWMSASSGLGHLDPGIFEDCADQSMPEALRQLSQEA